MHILRPFPNGQDVRLAQNRPKRSDLYRPCQYINAVARDRVYLVYLLLFLLLPKPISPLFFVY